MNQNIPKDMRNGVFPGNTTSLDVKKQYFIRNGSNNLLFRLRVM